ncbi:MULTISPECIES: hypothetical protein [unclassified Meiothermus]|uniref:hypothetical protein n=1 Tax=unclassified Meiothermus TaxID=370471 RepID=UPI000D7BD6EF|nr:MULTISPECIES: hypothetical protein [unclassified Meiothermus]PZA06502.1 hypothetical protein DNA98_13020 [Meiothermus sp. Pnk-1]RYM37175.1 hypothetical protein EWH23_06780 [Meiothermus sp. PNK-Is4]
MVVFALGWLACGLWVWALCRAEAARARQRLHWGWGLPVVLLGPVTPLLALVVEAARTPIDSLFDSKYTQHWR